MTAFARTFRAALFAAALFTVDFVSAAAPQEAQPSEAATRQFAAAVAFQNRGAYDFAAAEWAKFITNFPQDSRLPRAYHYLGVCYYQDGKLDAALESFQIVVTHYPKFDLLPTSYLHLGIAQYAVGQAGKAETYDRAVETLNTLIAKYPQSEHLPEALYYRAECLYARGKKAEAIESYSQLIAKYPTHKAAGDAMYALGVAQEEAGQLEAAGKTYDALLTRFPEHKFAVEVGMRRGDTLLALGQPAEALKRFTAAADAPGFPLADYATKRQADALYQLKNFDAAAKTYSSIPAKFPQSPQVQTAVVAGGKSFFFAGNYPESRKLLEKILQAGGPAGSEATHWFAQCLLKEKQPAAALAAVEKALPQAGSSPHAVQLLMDQADAMYDIPERRKDSVGLYATLAAKHPQDPVAPQAEYMAAYAAMELSDWSAALGYASKFLTAHRSHPLAADVMHVAAECNAQLDNFAEAERLYNELLQQYPNHADAELWRVRRVVSVHAQKKYAEAISNLQSLLGQLKSADNRAEAHYLIGNSQLELKQHDAAIKSFTDSLAAQPKWRQADETLLGLALAYRTAGDLEKAGASVQRMLAEFPQSRFLDRAHFRLGEYAALRGDFAGAADQFNQVVSKWPQSPLAPHSLFERGVAEFNRKDASAAEATLTTFLTQYPQHALVPRARYARAMARHQLGKFAPAVEDVQARLAANPEPKDRSDARFLLGLCQVELKQYDAAVATFQTLLAEDAGYAAADKARYQMAWALKLLGREPDAVKMFRELISVHAKSPLAPEAEHNIGEFAYAGKNYAAAAVSYYNVVQREQNTPLAEKAIHKLGWCYYHQGKFPDAQQSFAYQRSKYPSGSLAADAAFMEAECLFKQNKFAEALAIYETLPATSTKEFEALALLHAGESAGQLKQWDKAAEILARCVRTFSDLPSAPETLYALGWARQNLGQFKDATASYEQAIAVADKLGRPGSEVAARAQFMIGEIQFQNKEHAEAVKSYFKVAYGYSHPKWQADATYEAARCFEVLGQKTQAVRMYQELIDKHSTSDKVPLAKQRLNELKST